MEKPEKITASADLLHGPFRAEVQDYGFMSAFCGLDESQHSSSSLFSSSSLQRDCLFMWSVSGDKQACVRVQW